jgi:hypothetical protein
MVARAHTTEGDVQPVGAARSRADPVTAEDRRRNEDEASRQRRNENRRPTVDEGPDRARTDAAPRKGRGRGDVGRGLAGSDGSMRIRRDDTRPAERHGTGGGST